MTSDLTYALKELRANQDLVDEAQSYYEGTAQEIFFANPRLARSVSAASSKFNINYAKKPVDAVLSRLEINAVTSTDSAQQDAIDALWAVNRLGLEAPAIHKAALTFGETYLIIEAGDEEGTTVNMRHNTPQNMRAFYDDDTGLMTYAIKCWMAGEKLRVNLYYPDKILRYVSKAKGGKSSKTEKDFEPYLDDGQEDWEILHDYGRVPVAHFRTEGKYGSPEHAPAYGAQAIITKLIAVEMAAVDFASFPQRYGLAEAGNGTTEGFNPAEDDAIYDDEDRARSSDPDFVASPGSLVMLEGLKSVGEWSAAEPKAFLDPMKQAIQDLASVCDLPLHVVESGIPPSGESRRRAEAALTKKIGYRQLMFSETWESAFSLALSILGFNTNEDTLTVTWAPVQDAEDADSWNLVELKVKSGIPRRRALQEAGYTDEELNLFGIPDIEAQTPAPEINNEVPQL
jgi:hypothetical protein